MGLKAFNLLQKAGKYIRTYADEAISMSKKAGIAPIPINNTNKNLVTDVVEVASRKTNLKQRLIDGVVTQNTKSAGIKIPKGNFRAPRAGFEESLRAYKDIIKNNQDEIKGICAKYQKGLINEHEFANEYARFLSSKMNMPYYPELKQVIDTSLAGGMQNTTNTMYYNLSGMDRMSDLMQTVTHEMHHFLQQKEIFSTMSIEKFSKLKATADVKAILRESPGYYKTQQEIANAVSEQAECYIKAYKDAGWEKIIEKYPKNIDPKSPYYKRAQQLLDAELNYIDGTKDLSKYMSNILEKEAYEIGTHSQIDLEYFVFNNISKKDRDVAIEIYDCLNSPTFSDVSRAAEILECFNRKPYQIIEILKEAKNMGLNDAYSIIEKLL